MKFTTVSNPLRLSLQFVLLFAIIFFNFGSGTTQSVFAQSPSGSYGAAPLSSPPANDDFASPTEITGLTYTNSLNTTEATQDTTVPFTDPDNVGPCDGKQLNIGNNTVWYKYTPSVNESIAVDTTGSTYSPGVDLDTYVAIWTLSGGNLSLVKCDDDNLVGFTSQLSFLALASTTYYFEVASFNGQEGGDLGVQHGGNLVFNVNITNTDVTIGGNLRGSYYVYPDSSVSDDYGISDGPVHVVSAIGSSIFTSQRALTPNSFNSIIGIPGNQVTTDYWFTSYDDVGMITYLIIGNPNPVGSGLTALVDVYIGGVKRNVTPYSIAPGQRVYPRFGVSDGPVHVVSTNAVDIFASQRAKYLQSFNEVPGYPGDQVTSDYWFTSYDDVGMITYLIIGNPNPVGSGLTALVDV